MLRSLVGSEMCIRDRRYTAKSTTPKPIKKSTTTTTASTPEPKPKTITTLSWKMEQMNEMKRAHDRKEEEKIKKTAFGIGMATLAILLFIVFLTIYRK